MIKMKIKIVNSEEELNKVLKLRSKVFVEEQGVPEELERDEKDEDAIHLIAKIEENVVGCGRIVLNNNKGKIGRVAVAKNYRNQGLGTKICQRLIEIAGEHQLAKVILHAQYQTVDFYKELGFKETGTPFQEAGIKHIKMFYHI